MAIVSYSQSQWGHEVDAFIDSHGDRHVRQDSLDFYRNGGAQKVWAVVAMAASVSLTGGSNTTLVGVSLAGSSIEGTNASPACYSITVVHRDYRRVGIGLDLLTYKLNLIEADGYDIATLVAEDNRASLAMCKKAGLFVKGREVFPRDRGEYRAIILGRGGR